MTSGTMIERIARSIAGNFGSADWEVFIPAARAAALAMREPTLEMLEAATPGLIDFGYLPEEWQTMIDYVAGEHAK